MSEAENDSIGLVDCLMRDLNAFPVPTVALIHGACIGGGTGIAASCDVVIASERVFAVAEVKWGAHASPIFPQLIAAMGVRHLRRYAATAERFDALRAKEIGFVHEVCQVGGLDAALATVVDSIMLNGPKAVRRSKALALEISGLALDDATVNELLRSMRRRGDPLKPKKGFPALEKRPSRIRRWDSWETANGVFIMKWCDQVFLKVTIFTLIELAHRRLRR